MSADSNRIPSGVNDLALVKFRRGRKFFIPLMISNPDYSGWCVAAGWALYMSKVPQEAHQIYELQFHIGNRQCQPYFDISAEKIPNDIKEGYKRNKICSLLPGGDIFTYGIEDGDEGGPLICDNRLQGIISHYYIRCEIGMNYSAPILLFCTFF